MDWICDVGGWLSDLGVAVFGGWVNATQGIVGSVFAVVGAYWVGLRTQRRLTRDATERELAGRLIDELLDSIVLIQRAKDYEYREENRGVRASDWQAIRDARMRFERLLVRDGGVVNRDLQERLSGWGELLESVIVFEEETDGSGAHYLMSVEVATTYQDTISDARDLIGDLSDLRALGQKRAAKQARA